MTASEFYARTAELVAVLLPETWRELGPALGAALDRLDTDSGPVVDVGAGTGEGVRVVAATLPEAEVLAIEPDPALRTALLAVVGADPDLRRRVSVLDNNLAGASLPEQLSAVLLMNVLGHFSAAERLAVWDLLAARLAPTGRAMLTLYPPTVPQHVPSMPMAEARIGRRRYTGSATAEPSGPDAVDWQMSYRVMEAGATVAEFTARDRWVVVTAEQISEELRPRGLTITETAPDQFLYVVTRSSTTS
ncbi:class I SAM-dependent methyltransferase [Nocardia sp. NPDC023852]|uniref:class I SAM-dependent methyltransferase n=1 Tax=Nocardia sp. NPDC023852 TaxID=3154697 RepID=UPI0033D4462C